MQRGIGLRRSHVLASRESRPPSWVVAVVLAVSAVTITGAAVALLHPALLVGRDADIDPAAKVYAGYLISRNVALAVALLTLLVLRCHQMLAGALVFTALVQVLDAAIDAATGRVVLLPILAVLSAALLAAATRLSRQPLWHPDAWRTR